MTEPAEGGAAPEATTQQAPPGGTGPNAEVEALKAEVHQLREANRAETAARLGVQYGLDGPTVDVLKMLPRDQIETKAQEIAAARKPTGSAEGQPSGQTQPDPAAGSAPAAPAAPATPDAALAAVASGGSGQPIVGTGTQTGTSPDAELAARLAQAKNPAELAAIQLELANKRRELRARSIF